jgi:hypothetical protein
VTVEEVGGGGGSTTGGGAVGWRGGVEWGEAIMGAEKEESTKKKTLAGRDFTSMMKKLDDRVIQSPYHMTHSETKVVWLGSFMTQNVKTIAFGPSLWVSRTKKGWL